jgi:hypothetical protein
LEASSISISKFSFIIYLTGIILNSMSSTIRIFFIQPQPFSPYKYSGISNSGSCNCLLMLIFASWFFYEINPLLISNFFSSSMLYLLYFYNFFNYGLLFLFKFYKLFFFSKLELLLLSI